ncbi:MAG: hypothetical protein INR72_19135 [Williamsia herbipolensis]|nr:hypothetical protein [Williamsia herbipolensis]
MAPEAIGHPPGSHQPFVGIGRPDVGRGGRPLSARWVTSTPRTCQVAMVRVFLLTNSSTGGGVIGAFASTEAADRYIDEIDPAHVFTFDVSEVPWFDNYGVY